MNIDEELLAEAQRLSGAPTKTETVERGLRALVAREAALRLARLRGGRPDVEVVSRRRPAAKR